MDSYKGEQDDIRHHSVLEPLVNHCIAAIFDDNRFLIIFLDIWKRLHQHLRALKIGYLHMCRHPLFKTVLLFLLYRPIRCGNPPLIFT